jgi:predicted DNA-binding protein (MmcQ/YjbR family)
MSKTHWNTVRVNDLHDSVVKELIDHSYNSIYSLTKKIREEMSKL